MKRLQHAMVTYTVRESISPQIWCCRQMLLPYGWSRLSRPAYLPLMPLRKFGTCACARTQRRRAA